MYIRTIGIAILVVSGLVAGLPAQSKTFPVSELKPGMVATGRTVFQGDQIEEFKVHILGVLRNSIGPRRDLILARLEGGPLANTGVIAGMSACPVYIDGRLVGAVSYSLGEFSKEAIAGITPIEEMISDEKPKKKSNSNANRKKADTTRDVNASANSNVSSNSSPGNSNKKDPASGSNSTDKPNKNAQPSNPTTKPGGDKPKPERRP